MFWAYCRHSEKLVKTKLTQKNVSCLIFFFKIQHFCNKSLHRINFSMYMLRCTLKLCPWWEIGGLAAPAPIFSQWWIPNGTMATSIALKKDSVALSLSFLYGASQGLLPNTFPSRLFVVCISKLMGNKKQLHPKRPGDPQGLLQLCTKVLIDTQRNHALYAPQN